MRKTNIIALGFMTFSMFLGAGNVIFPPMIGQMAGHNTPIAGLGFIIGDVGLTLLGLIAISLAGGADNLLQDFPERVQKLFWVLLFIIIGPAFVIPRAAMVAYEIGFFPFVGANQWLFYSYIFGYLLLVMFLTLNPQKIVITVGKWMTPALLILLITIAVATLVSPLGTVQQARDAYQHQAFSEGLIQGYLTMDALGALGFGWILAVTIRSMGVSSKRSVAFYIAIAGVLAAIGMIIVYSAMLYLGATSNTISPNASNGGHILTAYVSGLFGKFGLIILAGVISLACMTTCIGVAAAGAEYFHKVRPKISYGRYVVFISICSAIISTIGLNKLIGITLPVIVGFYPVTIAVIATAILRRWLTNPKKVNYIVCSTALCFGVIDGINATGWLPKDVVTWLSHHLPLFDQGMGWITPGLVALLGAIICTELKVRSSFATSSRHS
ncbi:MAG: branched-chain amino acid transport system II carrier protein [Endozoicomonas sp. (ex Botrylloides leachii)]|nr:branched-chain amino acid transport system II carrier protein [Endozoicomonas sp. (ex Botrylloides leachii)]